MFMDSLIIIISMLQQMLGRRDQLGLLTSVMSQYL